jgi:hypothetical protein
MKTDSFSKENNLPSTREFVASTGTTESRGLSHTARTVVILHILLRKMVRSPAVCGSLMLGSLALVALPQLVNLNDSNLGRNGFGLICSARSVGEWWGVVN